MSKRLNMSNDEAVEWLLSLKNLDICGENRKTAIDKAIQALEAQPNSNEFFNFDAPIVKKSDAVSREAVKDGMMRYGFHAPDMTVTEFVEDCLPPIIPQTVCEDAVSREAVIRLIKEYETTPSYTDFYALIEDVKALPKESLYINPKKVGKWIEIEDNPDEYHYECSECGGRSYKGFEPLERYCPNCGAYMGGGEE